MDLSPTSADGPHGYLWDSGQSPEVDTNRNAYLRGYLSPLSAPPLPALQGATLSTQRLGCLYSARGCGYLCAFPFILPGAGFWRQIYPPYQPLDLSKHNLTCVAISLAPYQIMRLDRDKRFYNPGCLCFCLHSPAETANNYHQRQREIYTHRSQLSRAC